MKNLMLLATLSALVLVGCQGGEKESAKGGDSGVSGTKAPSKGKKMIAFVTNNSGDYWTIAQKGVEKAEKELPDYDVQFKIPQDAQSSTQHSIIDDLLTAGCVGIAVSPIDPKNGTAYLNGVAKKCLLITQDSDAPDSDRACYLGTDNIEAGHKAGDELKKALPNGGKVMVFVGKTDSQNSVERYGGLQDALKGSNITILGIKTDDVDHARAKQNVADAIVTYPDLAGCVGLWGHNGSAIYLAITEAHKQGKIKVVCFDEEDGTLAGIRDGTISATIVQNPFEFGYQSTKLMAKVLEGDKSVIPPSKIIHVDTRVITKENVEPFAAKLKELRGH